MPQTEEQEKRPTQLFMTSIFGIGHWFFGKADRLYDPASGLERFQTTVFVILFFFPLIPTGTYIVQKRKGFLVRKASVLSKLPLDWGQVVRVWLVASVALLALIWISKWV